MSQDKTAEFTGWRAYLWPVHRFELKKLLPMLLIAFCVSFNYTILRDTKDALIVTAPGSGAEAIPFLKVWGVVPCALIFMIFYAKLSNVLSKENLFYAAIAPFIAFFALFPLVIYPNIDLFHPTTSADWLQEVLPAGLGGLVACYRNWTYAVFYIMSELWGSAVLSLLFWGFANQITRVSESKRFYSLFALGLNVALMVSGPLIMKTAEYRKSLPADVDGTGVTLSILMSLVVAAALVIVATYRYMNRSVLTDARFFDPNEVKKPKKKKPKLSVFDSFKMILSSKYLGCLALLVIGYGISINLVEVTWKAQLKQQYPDTSDYVGFMGKFSTVTGLASILMLLCVGGNVIRKCGWTVAAMITPIVLAVTGGLFFGFVLFRDNLTGFIAMFGTSPLMLAVIFGAAQNIMSKSSKYSLFDPTKEMAYIPLDDEMKVKGKAAVDVVGARLGKSGGSLLQQGLLVLCGSVGAMGPYVGAILMVIIAAWLLAVQALGKMFAEATAQKEEESAQLAAENAETAVTTDETTSETATAAS